MNGQKRIIAVNDISCFGKCSLTVALPILSSSGVETVVLPTAILSTHTGGFTGYTFLDLTSEMVKIAKHWKSINLDFDCLYSGYLGSAKQIDITENIIKEFNIPFVFVDPVMGDNGVLYKGFDKDFPQKMKKLCKMAHIITPNITEAALLADIPYKNEHTKEYVKEILNKLSPLCDKIVMTGVRLNKEYITTAVYEKGAIYYIENKNIDGMYHGTGDVFASVLLSLVLKGLPLDKCAEFAVSYISECILKTKERSGNITYGVDFEECTKSLLKKLGEI